MGNLNLNWRHRKGDISNRTARKFWSKSCCACLSISGVKTLPLRRMGRSLKKAAGPSSRNFFNERSTLLLEMPKVRIMSTGLQLPASTNWEVKNLNCLRSPGGWVNTG